ncbi:MAG: RecX family transcriptional regulator [Tannerellaceae bacterium]|jgi:regulatory protein|nr:RecX family transcriptional regulator [Tannerellaceae bacterium]
MKSMKDTPSESEMLNRMAAYCASAERCPSDVERKLLAANLPAAAIRRILSQLTEQQYLDEARYAHSFANDKLRFNSWGRIKIAHELYQKRISSENISNAIAAISDECYQNILTELLHSKLKTMHGDKKREKRLKLLRFASGRGFEYDRINQCLAQLLKNEKDYYDDSDRDSDKDSDDDYYDDQD